MATPSARRGRDVRQFAPIEFRVAGRLGALRRRIRQLDPSRPQSSERLWLELGNELFAIFIYDEAITKEQTDIWYRQLAALGGRGRQLDPTRDWFSCDGDEDVRGTMPVWNKHFGHRLPLPDWMPREQTKPWMIGESGGSYYARPAQLAVLNGQRAFESYAGRNEALAIDVYDNIVNLARPKLAFYSPAETAWFGIEHLPLGYHDFTRLPNTNDGVWLQPFKKGQPGVQPERIPPYVCTLNPGWDANLPLYIPLAMFEAQKAAQVPGAPQSCIWDHKPEMKKPVAATVPATIERVAFLGARDGELFKRLTTLGLPLADAKASPSKLLIIEAATLSDASLARQAVDATLANQGTVLVMFRQAGEVPAVVTQLLPLPVTLTPRHATALVPRQSHTWTAGLGLTNLYFAEDAADNKSSSAASTVHWWSKAACCWKPAPLIGPYSLTLPRMPSASPSCCTNK